eukprot:scaffold35521_cov112-Isochrysis_galbana.AAC.2
MLPPRRPADFLFLAFEFCRRPVLFLAPPVPAPQDVGILPQGVLCDAGAHRSVPPPVAYRLLPVAAGAAGDSATPALWPSVAAGQHGTRAVAPGHVGAAVCRGRGGGGGGGAARSAAGVDGWCERARRGGGGTVPRARRGGHAVRAAARADAAVPRAGHGGAQQQHRVADQLRRGQRGAVRRGARCGGRPAGAGWRRQFCRQGAARQVDRVEPARGHLQHANCGHRRGAAGLAGEQGRGVLGTARQGPGLAHDLGPEVQIRQVFFKRGSVSAHVGHRRRLFA